jgi:hypothetical protein
MVQDSVKALEDSVSLALSSPDLLLSLREKIAAGLLSTPHFDTRLTTSNIESSYRCMQEIYEAGLDAMNVIVRPPDEGLPRSEHWEEAGVAKVVELLGEADSRELGGAVMERLLASFGGTSGEIHHLHGLMLEKEGRLLEAADAIKLAVELDSSVPFYHANLASILQRAFPDDPVSAANAYLAAFVLDPYVPAQERERGEGVLLRWKRASKGAGGGASEAS